MCKEIYWNTHNPMIIDFPIINSFGEIFNIIDEYEYRSLCDNCIYGKLNGKIKTCNYCKEMNYYFNKEELQRKNKIDINNNFKHIGWLPLEDFIKAFRAKVKYNG